MTSILARPRRLLPTACLILALVLVIPQGTAEAHGGRIKPVPPKPGDGGGRPDRPPRPDPRPVPPKPIPPLMPGGVPPDTQPGMPPTPVTPPTPLPVPGATPTTPPPTPTGTDPRPTTPHRKRGRIASAGSPDATWAMWWELNRWNYFPARSPRWVRTDAVTTPAGDSADAPLDREAIARVRRALVTRQQIVPFLLRTLDPARRARDEVRAAALIALARTSHDEEAVALILRHAEARKNANLVRESAAYAIGLLRRDTLERRMDGARLDLIRARLIRLLDDEHAPRRTRAFAALSLGMLGDQPFGSAFTKDGRMVTRALWERAQRRYPGRDLPVALVTAIGMQPSAGTSAELKDGLRRLAQGRRVGRRSWDSAERSHALAALARQEGDGWAPFLFRMVTDKRLPAQVRRAAFIAVGAKSGALSSVQRLDAVDAVERGVRLARDGLTRGLGQIALGRLVGADLGAGSAVLLERTGAASALLGDARHGAPTHRGFAAIALALAVRGAKASDASVLKFQSEAGTVLARGFEQTKDPATRGAYAVALGLLGPGDRRHSAPLTAVLADRHAAPALRGHAALALAQRGDGSAPVRKALLAALWDRRSVALRSQAALAMSFLGSTAETRMLVKELRSARSQWVLAQVAAALGRLGDVGAVAAVLEVAGDERREDEARALAIASLGLLGDPEPRPSTLRLTSDANYPARTDALHEAFSIL